MSVLINLNTSVSALGGGADAAAGTGEDWKLTIGGAWGIGEKVTLILTDSLTGLQTQIGAGNVTGLSPNFCFTYNNKLYMLAGSSAYFSALAAPATFNDPNAAGNDFITMSNFYATEEPLVGIAPYQGKLLFASRRFAQIWQTDPDPANYAQTQVLPNVGTFAAETLQPVGDMDVYMLADNGVRSVRVRDASNNATVADIGTPIDAIVQPLLAGLTDAQKAAACGIVEPSANRYWVYIPMPDGSAGSIYVYSNFPNGQIEAWTTYSPTVGRDLGAPQATGDYVYNGLVIGATYYWTKGNSAELVSGSTTLSASGYFVADANTATVTTPALAGLNSNLYERKSFVPVKFAVFNGQVYVRDSNGNIYLYGGADNNTYDNCGVSGIAPYLSVDAPATRKHFSGIDAAFQGTWAVSVSTDYATDDYKVIYQNTFSSFQRGSQLMNRHSTHYSLKFEENSAGYALFSSAAIHFTMEDEK
jgi:hypothetical protein